MGLLFFAILFFVWNAATCALFALDKRLHFLRGQNAIAATVVTGMLGGGPGLYFASRWTGHYAKRLNSTLICLAIWGFFLFHVIAYMTARGLLGYVVAAACWQAAVSALSFLLVVWDKRQAERGAGKEGRIAERDFVMLSLCGGFFGVSAGFRSMRHKTRHGALLTRTTVAGLAGLGIVAAILLVPQL
ncbi:MAG: DUF1294 domain-containing protein [Planctomycetes bacterium]|nr:DUF1294 domain-containing protein [Planctomycetota bacterium]